MSNFRASIGLYPALGLPGLPREGRRPAWLGTQGEPEGQQPLRR